MKRKRADCNGNAKENVTPNAYNTSVTPNPISEIRNHNLRPNLSSASVPVRSIFQRVLHEISPSPCSISSSSFNQKHPQSTKSPQTSNHIPVRLFGKIDVF